MPVESTLLVALDGSRNAETVLPYVEPVLRRHKMKALLLQVLPPGAHAPEAAAQAYLREISARLAKHKVKSEAEVVHGDPAVAIVRVAEKIKAGLVAFTSHGQGGLSQWVFGSVAQKILRGCSRPLLVVRALEESILTLKRAGLTMLVAAQDMRFAHRVADHLYVMNRGAVVYSGSIEEARRDEAVIRSHLVV